MIYQRELAPDDIRIPAVFALPELVANDQSRRAAAPLIVLCREEAAQRGFDIQRIEKVAAHIKHPGGARLPARRKIDGTREPGEDAGKGLLPLLDLLPNRICN